MFIDWIFDQTVTCLTQFATGNPVPVLVPVDPTTFFRSGSGPVQAKY